LDDVLIGLSQLAAVPAERLWARIQPAARRRGPVGGAALYVLGGAAVVLVYLAAAAVLLGAVFALVYLVTG
jgi:hypothetical protein